MGPDRHLYFGRQSGNWINGPIWIGSGSSNKLPISSFCNRTKGVVVEVVGAIVELTWLGGSSPLGFLPKCMLKPIISCVLHTYSSSKLFSHTLLPEQSVSSQLASPIPC